MSIVAITAVFSLALYLLGAYVIYRLGLAWLAAYLIYIFLLEIRLIKGHCVDCYYYGKYCAFGRGKISCLFFKKGDSKRFVKKQISWKDIVPDFLVAIIPIIAGIWLLLNRFDWLLLAILVVLFLLMSIGNAWVRGSLACKYCKQRQLGCLAERLFKKKEIS